MMMCWANDLCKKVAICLLYVFQGDGTAAIFHDNDYVFTFSLHCGANFPLHKQQSDLDVSLEKYVAVGDMEPLRSIYLCP